MRGSQVKVPWSSPIADPDAQRIPARTFRADSSQESDWPFQWDWPGLINTTVTLPGIRIWTPRALSRYGVTFRSTGTTTTIQVLKNGVVQSSAGYTFSQQGAFSAFSFVQGDTIAIRISAVGTGVNEGLWFGLG